MIGLLDYIADVYHNRKEEVAEQTKQIREQRAQAETSAPSDLDPDTATRVIAAIKSNFDPAFGGFGREPKSPTLKLSGSF